jgi:predicted pyridoxine 5'-phosphate oxidase superfamily flavin-nucleotide-binding protein
MNYSKLAFSNVIKAIQEKLGSREAYERVENRRYVDGLTPIEKEFIEQMDSFYMASSGENGYPYIQHRGGPKGFIKVIDDQTIGIVDFSGNRQYISVGNITQNPKVSLILVSYPMQARLKIYAEAEIAGLEEKPDLFNLLKPEHYKYKPERLILFHIKAYDWNCPQHITPRYTTDEINALAAPREKYILELEQELKNLRQKLEGN